MKKWHRREVKYIMDDKSFKLNLNLCGVLMIILWLGNFLFSPATTMNYIIEGIQLVLIVFFWSLTKSKSIAGPIIGIILGILYFLNSSILGIIIGITLILVCTAFLVHIKNNK